MNIKFDFTETGGFPLDQGVLNDLQNGILNVDAALANVSGPLAILAGCVITGGSAGNGVVAINGEVLPFVGGTITAKVIIIQTTTNLTYFDDDDRPSQITRYATFGDDGVQNNPWANFKRNTSEGVFARLDRVEKLLLPFSLGGGMLLWNRPYADIPTGWREVTDWQGRLPMGYKPSTAGFAIGDIGGSAAVTIAESNIQKFQIDLPTNDTAVPSTGSARYVGVNQTSGDTAHANVGVDTPTPIALNPYRIVVFIEPVPGSF